MKGFGQINTNVSSSPSKEKQTYLLQCVESCKIKVSCPFALFWGHWSSAIESHTGAGRARGTQKLHTSLSQTSR